MDIPDFMPESLVVLQSRYKKSVEETLDPKTVEEADWPGLNRKHIFDFQDGMRMIICKEIWDQEVYIHFSTSALPGTRMYAAIAVGSMSFARFRNLSLLRFRKISGDVRPAERLLGQSAKGVPHWLIKD